MVVFLYVYLAAHVSNGWKFLIRLSGELGHLETSSAKEAYDMELATYKDVKYNHRKYPVMIIGAGLPKIYKMLSDEKSYSERLFMYKQIGSLTLEQSKKR